MNGFVRDALADERYNNGKLNLHSSNWPNLLGHGLRTRLSNTYRGDENVITPIRLASCSLQ